MIDIARYFAIPFTDPAISLNEILAFATDSHQRMIANNPGGAFTTNIAATATVIATLGTCSADDLTKLGLRKAAKQAKDTFRGTLPAAIQKIHGRVLVQYGDPSPQLTQCFPAGRSIWQTEVDDKIDDRLQALINALAPLIITMGGTASAEATALLSAWTALYNASEASTAAKSFTQAEKKVAREALDRQLSLNVLTVAIKFIGQPEKAAVYFQQHLIEDHPAAPTPPPVP